MQTHVTWQRRDDLAEIVLACDTPGKPPTFDLDTLAELDRCLAEIEAQAGELAAVVVRSESEKYFVTGANIRALQGLSVETMAEWGAAGHAVFGRLEALPLPTIARVDGYALGGGLELALACDLIVAHESAQLGLPEVRLGLVPGWGGTLRLARRVGPARAKLLMFSGRALSADVALAWGLVEYAGDTAGVEAYLAQLLDDLRAGSRRAIGEIKALVQSDDLGWEDARDREAAASERCLRQGDAAPRIAAFLARRNPKAGEPREEN